MVGTNLRLSGSAKSVVVTIHTQLKIALAGHVPAIHAFLGRGPPVFKTWMPGSSPGKASFWLHRMPVCSALSVGLNRTVVDQEASGLGQIDDESVAGAGVDSDCNHNGKSRC